MLRYRPRSVQAGDVSRIREKKSRRFAKGTQKVMQLIEAYFRVKKYFVKYGLTMTVWRLFTFLKRRLFYKRQVVFWVDLSAWEPGRYSSAEEYGIQRIEEFAQLSEPFRARLRQEHAEELIDRTMKRRFEQHATLWCLTRGADFIGYMWSIPGRTLKPYFFPLTAKDVHLFDNFVFPEYRGNRLNSILVSRMLDALKKSGYQRAYAETGEWNEAELRSFARIGFSRMGFGRKRARKRKNLVAWWSFEEPSMKDGTAKAG